MEHLLASHGTLFIKLLIPFWKSLFLCLSLTQWQEYHLRVRWTGDVAKWTVTPAALLRTFLCFCCGKVGKFCEAQNIVET